MRLGQLARKLALRPAEIIEFLAANNIQIQEEPNTKLEEKHLVLLLQRFAPDLQLGVTEEENREEVLSKLPEVIEKEEVPVEQTPELDVSLPVRDAEEEKEEVIKAPRVELSGLKVLGKIDLPEPKKKLSDDDPQLENESVTEPKVVRPEKPKLNLKSNRTYQRATKNPIALEREKEALEAKTKREEEARVQKEKRTQNYLRKAKSPQPTRAARWINEPSMEMSAAELKEAPKTWWGKFVKWLTH